MHFMNNKREVTTYSFDVAASNFLSNSNSNTISQLANIIANNEHLTNKDEYLDKVIKKYTIYDDVVDGVLKFKFFNENSNEVLIDDLSEILKTNSFYSFHYFGNAINYPFKFNLNNDDNFIYEYAFYNITNKLIKNPSSYIKQTQNETQINLSKGLIFVLNVKEKTPSTYNFFNNTISYYSSDYDKRQYLKYVTPKIDDLINSSLSIAPKPIKDGDLIESLTNNDTLFYNTNYIISNLKNNITLKTNSIPNNFIYNIYYLTPDETTTTIKEEYIVKPNEILIVNLKEKIKQHTTRELENLSFETWAKIPNITNSIENNIKLIPFFSLNDMTFEELKDTNITDSLLHDWKYISANSYEEKKEEAKKLMNEYQQYYKYIVDIRLAFTYGTESISYFYYDKNGDLLIKEDSKELTGKYILLYPYYPSVDESISNVINLKNDTKSVNLKFVTPLEYNKVESLGGNVLISKIRIQTNDNEHIIMNKPSWNVKKLFIWNNNDNIIKNNNNVIKGTSDDNIIPYISGINEVLDNEKQYLEIKLEKPIVYNNIQHIFIESGLNKNNDTTYVTGNINTTSLLFYDSNNNQIENYTIDFSKVEFKDSVNSVENVDNIYLLKGPAYESYSKNVYDPEYANKPTTFATNYITSDKIAKFEKANNINMKLVN
jgi:hypothetical protein